jgi:hypothetical protein
MAGNQHNDWGHSDVGQKTPDQGKANKAADSGDNPQSAAGTPASSGVYTNFQHASPESNVNPPGAPQNSHGSATGPLPGGVEGQYQASQSAQADNARARQGLDDDDSDKGIEGAGPDGGAPAGNGNR